MSDTGNLKNTIPPEFTGITAALGGTNAWAPYGGARYVLVDTENKKYQYFDLTQATQDNPTIIKYTINVSQLQCGFNNAVYMVPMTSTKNDGNPLHYYAGTLYNDAQGIGFVNKEDTGMNSLEARTEIDLTECSPRAIQSTLHGYGKKNNPKKSNRWLRDLDMDGIWENANVNKDGSFRGDSLIFGNSKQGDKLADNAIDTKDPIDVQVTLYSVKADDNVPKFNVAGPFYTLNMEVIISQPGRNSFKLTVDSNNPNKCCNIKTYFPESELKYMVLLWSFWADVEKNHYLQWLDGSPPDTDFGAKRGNCEVSDYKTAGDIQQAINDRTYDNKYSPNDFKSNKFFTNFYNLSFKTPDITIDSNNKLNYGMILDYGYRGINLPKDSKDSWTPFSAGKEIVGNLPNIGNWHGRYNYSYLGCNIDPKKFKMLQNKDIFEITSTDQPWPTSGKNSILNTICMDVFGKDGVIPMYPENTNVDMTCSWDGSDTCQYLNMPLVEFSSIPTPPTPPGPPGPSPGPPGPHSSSLNIVGIISLSLSALIIIIILLMIFDVKFTF